MSGTFKPPKPDCLTYTNLLSALFLSESQVFLGFVLRSELLLFLHRCQTQHMEGRLDEVCSIHPNLILVSPHNTVEEVYSILTMTRAQTLFVADKGKLVGQITWSEMKQILDGLAKEI
ncbi:hypothetical protein GOODEAATRI_008339 [Goodea atripinnis]|uniref:CBS domain-containing protein n=1 Tax=Goodea atripinnis TaxID=208336 RepID=A0ABV0MZN6_9TELE